MPTITTTDMRITTTRTATITVAPLSFMCLADALTFLLAIAALLAGKYAGWDWMDPTMGIVGAILVTRWSWQLLRDTSRTLLDRQ